MKLKTAEEVILNKHDGSWPFKDAAILFLNAMKTEAIKRVKNCRENECVNKILGFRCSACKRDIWVNNLTEEDLK